MQVSDGSLLCSASPTSLTKQYSSPMLGPSRWQSLLQDQATIDPSLRPREPVRELLVAAGRRSSKTLPRGFSLSQAVADAGDSVYGMYGDLLNVRDYECDSTELGRTCQEIHRSDPELDTIPYRVSTLDRRVTMKSQRPRSLDLSSWSVESRASSITTSSSDTSSEYASPSVSRNASFISNRSSFAGPPEPASPVLGGPELKRRPSHRQPVRPKPVAGGQRTVTTLMGGRGYIQWRGPAGLTAVNNSDAYLVVWDHKL